MISTTIVGAGPAGSSTAKAILEEDPDHIVTIIDIHKEPWNNIQCAGGISAALADEMRLKVPKEIIRCEFRRLIVNSPNQSFEISGLPSRKRVIGFALDRAAFDKWLLDQAIDAGANTHLGMKARGLNTSTKGGIPYVNLKIGDNSYLPSEYLIGADGVNSRIGNWSGICNGQGELHIGYQETWRMPDYPQDTIMIWFDTDWIPEGYAWAFPEGNEKVRIGLGVPPRKGGVKNYFNKFITECDYIRNSMPEKAENPIGGLISTGAPLKTCVNDRGNIAVVGCAGFHTSSLHGGGILHAITAGKELGTTIGRGEPLKNYDKRWKAKLGRRLRMHYKLKRMICNYSNNDFDRLCAVLSDFELSSNTVDREFLRFIKHVLSKDAGLIPSVVRGLVK